MNDLYTDDPATDAVLRGHRIVLSKKSLKETRGIADRTLLQFVDERSGVVVDQEFGLDAQGRPIPVGEPAHVMVCANPESDIAYQFGFLPRLSVTAFLAAAREASHVRRLLRTNAWPILAGWDAVQEANGVIYQPPGGIRIVPKLNARERKLEPAREAGRQESAQELAAERERFALLQADFENEQARSALLRVELAAERDRSGLLRVELAIEQERSASLQAELAAEQEPEVELEHEDSAVSDQELADEQERSASLEREVKLGGPAVSDQEPTDEAG